LDWHLEHGQRKGNPLVICKIHIPIEQSILYYNKAHRIVKEAVYAIYEANKDSENI